MLHPAGAIGQRVARHRGSVRRRGATGRRLATVAGSHGAWPRALDAKGIQRMVAIGYVHPPGSPARREAQSPWRPQPLRAASMLRAVVCAIPLLLMMRANKGLADCSLWGAW